MTSTDNKTSPVETAGPDASTPAGPRVARRHRDLVSIAAPLAVVVIALAVSLLHISRFSQISILDEFQHADYVERLMHFELPSLGSRIEEPTLREDACRGHQDLAVPPCDQPVLTTDEFPGGGYQSAAAHPPGYYAVAAVAARTFALAPGKQSFVTGARLASAALTAAGCLALYALLRILFADRVVGACVALLAITAPSALHASAVISPDATAILCGAGIPALFLLRLRGSISPRWLVLAAVLLGLSKVNNLIVLGVVAAMALGVVLAGHVSARAAARAFLLLGLPACLTYAGWTVLSRLYATDVPGGMPIEQMFTVDSLDLDQVWNALPAVFPPSGGIVGDQFAIVPFSIWAVVIGWLLIGGTFLAVANESPPVKGLGWGVFVSAALTGPFLVITNFVLYDEYYDIPSRYGMVLIPAMLVGLGISLTGRRGRFLALAIASAGLLSYAWVFVPHRP